MHFHTKKNEFYTEPNQHQKRATVHLIFTPADGNMVAEKRSVSLFKMLLVLA